MIWCDLTGRDDPYFPIVEFLDVVLPAANDEFVLDVLPMETMGDVHGMTYPDRNLIQIREDVYLGAKRGIGRDRMTMAHELGHYVLHAGLGLARAIPAEKVAAYRSSEWQANAFAGELLISANHISVCRNASEAKLKFGVSAQAAEYQWRIFERDGLVRKR